LIGEVAKDVPITYIGGTSDGGIGSSFDSVQKIVELNQAKELLAFYDLGSARMNLELVDDFTARTLLVQNVPIVEGAYTAAALLQAGADKDSILTQLDELTITK
ncbi:TPA: PTS-dependent dihydroxyacetone kinase phosphotransferase subunit DhaM, partial [Streptococcus equi subsp. zooepidemicus]|nr:PTS-dependent dihydroxyacetone kinase phosphotransferase subunit DhaM [Streptococcus equi subsp. zooepidemicus]